MPNIYMAFPEGKRKALTLSYDDGVEQDIRLVEIMARYGLKGTFNINSGLYAPKGKVWPEGQVHRRMDEARVTALFAQSGQEVAIHASEHGDLAMLPAPAAIWQVMKDKEALERQFGRIIRGMAYPFGTVTDELAKTLKDCGIAYSRTTVSTGRFDVPRDWLKLPATCHHTNPELMHLAHHFVEDPVFNGPKLFYLWGHSYEFEAADNWNVIEEFAAYTGNREDIWYATNIQVHDYVEAWRAMESSAAGDRLFNPSCIPLFVRCGEQTFTILPGQEITLA